MTPIEMSSHISRIKFTLNSIPITGVESMDRMLGCYKLLELIETELMNLDACIGEKSDVKSAKKNGGTDHEEKYDLDFDADGNMQLVEHSDE
jgi:hypothetical protein